MYHGGGSSSDAYKGRWCMPCILFLTDSEKVPLKSFVNIPFVNYNKSKEILSKHSMNVYVSFACSGKIIHLQNQLLKSTN